MICSLTLLLLFRGTFSLNINKFVDTRHKYYKGSLIKHKRKIFQKTNISYPLIVCISGGGGKKC